MRYLKTIRLLAVLSLVPLFPSCDGPWGKLGNWPGDEAALQNFSFPAAVNSGFSNSTTAISAREGYYFVTVPDGTDRTRLVPDIEVSDGATVTIDGVPFVPGNAYDFSGDIQTVSVVSESGQESSHYKVLVKTGVTDVDNQVYEFMKDFQVPGVSLSVMKGAEIVYSGAYGFADVGNETRCTPEHLFRVADISKQFCVMCIMRLKEMGRLELDQKVFGEEGILRDAFFETTPYHESITVRHLLSHSSGITSGLEDPAFNDLFRLYKDTQIIVPIDTLIQRTLKARKQPFDDGETVWGPDVAYDYSNVGFCILQRVVEHISGKDFESFLKEDVLDPMEVTDTHVSGNLDQRRPNECVYYLQGNNDVYRYQLRELAGAMGIITSPRQMMRVLTYIDGDDTVSDILSHETLDEMYAPYRYTGNGSFGERYKRYGLGWRVNHPSSFQEAHYHEGSMAGTAALWAGSTNDGMSGAIVCNTRTYNNGSSGDMDESLSRLLDRMMRYFRDE